MDRYAAIAVSSAFQIGSHAAVAINTVMAVVDFFNLFLYLRLLGAVIRLPVFSVVIIGIRTNLQPAQQPADTEFFMISVNESISL